MESDLPIAGRWFSSRIDNRQGREQLQWTAKQLSTYDLQGEPKLMIVLANKPDTAIDRIIVEFEDDLPAFSLLIGCRSQPSRAIPFRALTLLSRVGSILRGLGWASSILDEPIHGLRSTANDRFER